MIMKLVQFFSICLAISALTFGPPATSAASTADDYLKRGDKDAAKRALDKIIAADDFQDSTDSVLSLRTIASQFRQLGARSNAVDVLKRAASIAEQVDRGALPGILIELGNTQGETESHKEAKQSFNKLLKILPKSKPYERAMAWVYFLKTEVRSEDNEQTISGSVSGFLSEYNVLTSSRCDMALQFAGTLLLSRHNTNFADEIAMLLKDSAKEARESGDVKSLSYARGYMAKLSEAKGDLTNAQKQIREAILLSVNNSPEQTYLWQWQLGRVLAKTGDRQAAITNYEQAIETLALVQGELLKGSYLVFRERILPVYNELIDLLLLQAQASSSESQRQRLLAKVQGAIEAFNKSEILDYFDDDCVLPAVSTRLADIANDTVVVYPILLADRVVILTKLPTGMHQYVSRIALGELKVLVQEFRDYLQGDGNATTEEIQETGAELYDVLIKPIAKALEAENIRRIVFVPAAQLRMIPMSALYDGSQYLVEQYEIATTLGLTLTDPHQPVTEKVKPLIGGISDSVQGFVELPGVRAEVDAINAQLGGDVMMNQNFTLAEVEKSMSEGDYNMIHLATHGVFQGEAANSFLLAYEDKLTLDKLQDTIGARRFLGNPLDLLVLSACETAAGNDRAALGLAGVSLKAGARSTIASLWPISDEGTSLLMVDFYRNLQNGQSKSAALRTAQLKLINNPLFKHPNSWSPFLLIGNWL
ncbi:MAG: CHAT domain-containing protein [Candidatus Azotimanducaceae bacterium]|jgi:CHAT domain-containing protein